jgi:exosortase
VTDVSQNSATREFQIMGFLALLVLWGQLYFASIPLWRYGEYYGYGWFVPPLAMLLFFRRWRRLGVSVEDAGGWWRYAAVAAVLLPVLVVIRAVAAFDPAWRPALLAQAVLVVVATHLMLYWWGGKKLSLGLLPVTIYALSAIPYPFQIEQWLIRTLTGGVSQISGGLFNMMGRPVEVRGETLESLGTVVEVAEGCSGIRSFQNLVMAALFFGEFFLLGLGSRVVLLAVAAVAAVVVNIGRAMTLARIRFDEGEVAFDAAHDNVGFLAFGICALILLLAAKWLGDRMDSKGVKRKLVRRTTTAS